MFDYRLYLITDGKPDLLPRVREALQGGVTVVQYREKKKPYLEMIAEANQLKKLCHEFGVPLIINDYVGIAKTIEADGLHLGQSDTEYEEARAMLGPDFPIGISARTVEEAKIAEANGASYIGVGALFPTGSKADAKVLDMGTVREIEASVSIPTLLIGGISSETLPKINAKYDGLCVISGILGVENIRAAAEGLLCHFQKA
ncbi:MAG: thiamine phosphate synthase [Turicibacter sp.]|nr:thiamine phosphate synthase [Turicibacter sp.]